MCPQRIDFPVRRDKKYRKLFTIEAHVKSMGTENPYDESGGIHSTECNSINLPFQVTYFFNRILKHKRLSSIELLNLSEPDLLNEYTTV